MRPVLLLLLLLAGSSGCAAAARRAPPARRAPTRAESAERPQPRPSVEATTSAGASPEEAQSYEQEQPQHAEPVPFERILGAFLIGPDSPILIDPRTCQRRCTGETDELELALATLSKRTRAQGVARLNLGAQCWAAGDGDKAYQQLMLALSAFAELGDAGGLASSHEWIGFMLAESGAKDVAEEHLALAHQLFEKLGDGRAAARVLAYSN